MAGVRKLLPRFSLRTLVVFLLLVTAGMGLWWHWKSPWQIESAFKVALADTPFFVRLIDGAQRLEVVTGQVFGMHRGSDPAVLKAGLELQAHVYEVPTGKPLGSSELPTRWVLFESTGFMLDDPEIESIQSAALISPDRVRRLQVAPFFSLAVPLTGRLSDGYYPLSIVSTKNGKVLQVLEHDFSSRGTSGVLTRCSCFSADGTRLATVGEDGWIHIWRRTRPEWWWWMFYLREFWLTAVFAGLFIWSVIRDRRRLARAG